MRWCGLLGVWFSSQQGIHLPFFLFFFSLPFGKKHDWRNRSFSYLDCITLLGLNRLFWQHLPWQWMERELFCPRNNLNTIYSWCYLCIQCHRQDNQPCLNPSVLALLWLGRTRAVFCSSWTSAWSRAQQWYHAKKMLFSHLEGSFQHYIQVSSPNGKEKGACGAPDTRLCHNSSGILMVLQDREGTFADPIKVVPAVLWHWKAQHPGTTDKQLNPFVAFGFLTFVNVGTVTQPNLEKMP